AEPLLELNLRRPHVPALALQRAGLRKVELDREDAYVAGAHAAASLVSDDRVQPPLAGDALQLVDAAVVETQARAGDEVLDRAGDEHLARAGERGDPRARVDGDPRHLAFGQLALPGVQAGAHLEAELPHRLNDRTRAADRPRRPVEGGEEAVPGRVQLTAAEAGELAAYELVVAREQLPPGAIAERGRTLAGRDDIREQDGRQDAVALALLPGALLPELGQEPLHLGVNGVRPPPEVEMADTGHLDEERSGDALRHVPGRLELDHRIVRPVHDQR